MTAAPKLRCETNYALNLWVHLETACGRPRIYHSEKYDREVASLTKGVKTRFVASHRGYAYSLRMRREASLCEDAHAFIARVGSRNGPLRRILGEADCTYRDYWRREACPKVVRVGRMLTARSGRIRRVILQIPRFTGVRQWPDVLTIFPIHCLSERFQFGAQPIFPDKVLFGEVDPSLAVLLLAHELVHLNAHDAFTHACRTLRLPYPTDVVDEVLTNVVVNAMILKGVLTPPTVAPPSVQTPEYGRFKKKFDKVNSKLIHLSGRIPHELTAIEALKGLEASV